ncbi:MAG TPA: hypothetical protein VKQ10_03420, partial [Spirochaetota bacterium]|nr:hypothetical protein [Spirochaetota bacterium]
VHSSKIFIYYEASNIQTGTAIDLSTVNGRISAIENGKRYTVSNPSCDLTISDSDPIYGISLSTSPTLTAEDLTTVNLNLTSLNAYLIGN